MPSIGTRIEKLTDDLWKLYGEANGSIYDDFLEGSQESLEKLQTVLNTILI